MKLSKIQKLAVNHAKKHGGILICLPVGYWATDRLPEDIYFHTSTVLQLVNNGVANFDREIQPTKCILTPAAMLDFRCGSTFDDGCASGPHNCELIYGHNGKCQSGETVWG